MKASVRRIDHVAIAVSNFENAIELYTTLLGKGPSSIADVADQKVRTAFFDTGETSIELLFPTSEDSPISKFLRKRGEGMHHICFEVLNIQESLDSLQDHGIELIDEIPRVGAHDKKIAFLSPKSTHGVLIELSESMNDCPRHPNPPGPAPEET